MNFLTPNPLNNKTEGSAIFQPTGRTNSVSIWNRAIRSWRNLGSAARERLSKVDADNQQHNVGVASRQVLRAKARAVAFEEITKDFGGEPRAARRRMARNLARRGWRGRQAAA